MYTLMMQRKAHSGILCRNMPLNNDKKCTELNWVCVQMAVEVHVYGAWGEEASHTFSRLTTRLAVKTSEPRSEALSIKYTRINSTLVRANARALLGRVMFGNANSIHFPGTTQLE